jgi:hypothetical protein
MYAKPAWTVPELFLGMKQLIPALQQLSISYPSLLNKISDV